MSCVNFVGEKPSLTGLLGRNCGASVARL